MRIARILVASTALAVAGCSSGGSDGAPPSSAPESSPAEATVPSTEVVDPPAPTSVADAEPEPQADEQPVPVTASTSPDEPVDPLVIDGPASVRPSCASLPRGVSAFTLEGGGATHDVRMYVPETLSSDPAPTVLNWHGLGSNGPDQANFTGYETLAEEEGFIVVHPTGVDAGTGATSWEVAQFDSDVRDDLAFADALIDTVVADWCGDPARIYSTGMSNGGLFTSELVCNRSLRIAAAVSVAGTTHAPSCDPERPVPYMAFHGTADTVVPFDAAQPSILLPPEGVALLIDDTTPGEFAEFAADAACEPVPTRTEETDEVVRYDYTGCADDVPMTFYEIVGGGHTWPSSPQSDTLSSYGLFTQDVDATGDAWAFMSQFSL